MNRHLCVIGMQQGDEGKGKIVDALSANVHAVARYQGGGNAGHTVYVEGKKYVLHQIPTGVLHDGVHAIMGNGMVIEPNQFMEEFNLLSPDQQQRIYISDRAHLTTKRLLDLDTERETAKGATIIGTCRRGIGPTYESKYARTGIRMGDLHRGLEGFTPEDQEILKKFYDAVGLQICDTAYFLHSLDESGKTILFEGAQGILLDVDFGAYPFCTSSHCTAMGLGIGTGFSPRKVGRVIGVAKAYPTKVGTGPFPSMANPEDDEMLRQKGNEFGATTGRPRKCGWLDIPAMRYAIKVGDIDEVALTKVDILTGIAEIPVCVAYRVPGMEACDGIDYYPSDTKLLEQVEPVWETWRGWTNMDELVNLEIFIRRLETALDRPITMVGCGPNRDDIIYR